VVLVTAVGRIGVVARIGWWRAVEEWLVRGSGGAPRGTSALLLFKAGEETEGVSRRRGEG
jgi:hypothetical protein